MKFYNPFQPHVVHFDGVWAVRRMSPFWWEYMDRDDAYWWGMGYGKRWYQFHSEAEAVARLLHITKKHSIITVSDAESSQ